MFHRQSSNSIKQLKCGYKIECKSQQDRSRRLPPFSWRIAKLKSIRKANHGRSIHESYSIRSLKFPFNKRFRKPNFFRGSLLRFTTRILKWLQVTWSLACYFRQSQLTEMLASEHCRTGGSAENRFYPQIDRQNSAWFRQNKRLESQQDGLLHVLLSPWFLTVRYLSMLWNVFSGMYIEIYATFAGT